ncbi:LysR family transcriptional regulator [Thalassospira marina]|uniref:HTH lysR-type domain-containing protein n=1 Tax=Thalassospira marina TaxID=2048283 RepID=A0A2N3KEN7_9PROT|nr:LysR family transcriptional regulator [Thalassospira marina]AUG55365.1 hypothetical protein CSC3H3_21035 [Thalassospira marina]PKR49018.1 hypothetical protein COO20_22925 [Thalassospira marina]
MDTTALAVTYQVLALGGVRAAARALKRSPGSIAAAVSRLEGQIAVPLTQKAGNGLSLTLEARRLTPDFEMANTLIGEMAALVMLGPSALPQMPGIGKTDTKPNDVTKAKSADRSAAKGKTAPKTTGRTESFDALPPTISMVALARFILVVRTGSIRRAAREIGIGQPQLTRQMSHLESQIGQALLVRSCDGVLTSAVGSRFLAIAEQLDEVWLRLSNTANDRFRRMAATSRLGSVTPLGYESETARLLATLVASWLREHPQRPLFVSTTTAEELLAGLKSGLFDVAVLDTDTKPSDLGGQTISRSSLVLAGSSALIGMPDHDVARVLTSFPIAVPSLRTGLRHKIANAIADVIPEESQHKINMIEVDSIPVIVNLILQHEFITILPEFAVHNIGAPLVYTRMPVNHDLSLSLVWPNNAAAKTLAMSVLEILGFPRPASLS